MPVEQASQEPESQFVIEDVDGLKALAEPVRFRILSQLFKPRTVKEIAAALNVPQTRLYYHIKILERAGIIRVAARRLVSGIEERSYEAAASSITIAPALLGDAVRSGLLKAVFDLTRVELEVVLPQKEVLPGEPGSTVLVLSFSEFWLRDEELADFTEAFRELMSRYFVDGPGPGLTPHRGLFTVYRVPGPAWEEPPDAS